MYEPIGCDKFATEVICNEFLTNRDSTLIKHMATGGDSAAFRSVQKALKEYGQTVEALTDTRQVGTLSNPRRRQRTVHNLAMFPGRTPSERQDTKRKISVDLIKRFTAEYVIAQKKYCGKMIHTLSFASETTEIMPQICIIIMSKSHKNELF